MPRQRASRRRSRKGKIDFTKQASVAPQVTPRPVPRTDPNVATAGLSTLNNAIARHFGSVARTLDQAANQAARNELAEIKKGNEKQALQGSNDALSGAEPDAGLAKDLDYTDAYSIAKGQVDAGGLVADFATNVLPTLSPDADFQTAVETFLKDRLRNGDTIGLPNEERYNNALLGAFRRGVDGFRAQHQTAKVKNILDTGVQNHRASLGALLPDMTASDLPEQIEIRKKLMPTNPQDAASSVVGDIVAAAGSSPEMLQKVARLLTEPESGDGDRSFAQLFPKAFDEINSQMHSRIQNGFAAQGIGERNRVHEALAGSTSVEEVTDAMEEAQRVHSLYGGNSWHQQFRLKALGMLQKLAEEQVGNNRLQAMIAGKIPVVASEADKGAFKFMEKNGIGLDTPDKMVAVITGLNGHVGKNVKAMLADALVSPDNPEAFGNTIRVLNGYARSTTPQEAISLLDGPAKAIYAQARRLFTLNKMDPETIANVLGPKVQDIPKLKELSWQTITGSTKPGVTAKVDGMIRETLEDIHGTDDFQLTPGALAALRDNAKFYAAFNQSSWKDEVEQAVRDGVGLTVLPGRNGQLTITTAGSLSAVKFGEEIYNPATGQTENTIETWETDKADFTSAFSTAEGDNLSLEVPIIGQAQAKGFYQVMNSGMPLMIEFGKTYPGVPAAPDPISSSGLGGIGTNFLPPPPDTVVPKDPKKAAAFMQRLFEENGDRFAFAFNNPANPTGVIVFYKPGFTGQPLPTREEQDQSFTAPTPQTTPTEDFLGVTP